MIKFQSSRRTLMRSMMGGSLLMPGIVSQLLAEDSIDTGNPLAPRSTHFPAAAKNVIMIYATGGVSHIDTFDPKSTSNGRDGSGKDRLMGSLFGASPNKSCGTMVSDIFPHVRDVMDEICLIRSMKASHFDHSEATLGMHTGSPTFARPSMGSWVSYGLGSENQNLPSFIVMAPHLPYGGTQVYASDFLPAFHQGTRMIPGENPIANLVPPNQTGTLQSLEIDFARQLNQQHFAARTSDSALAARMKSFETAFQMQVAAPEAFDVDSEPEHIRTLYGLDRKTKGPGADFAWQCLVARRLVERGVRFIELIDTGSRPNWDSHGEMNEHKDLAANVDQPTAALIKDLRQRGMLNDTIVLWATEFGRTPTKEGQNGRGHHRDCFSVWLAGGGFKRGHVHGVTDEIGKYTVENPVEVHDLHATILHQLGLDHEKLTFRHAGRDFRLTDVHGTVLKELIA
ncbi:DUF1501 domain-containing protein [Rhodopirellula sp. MGV]|uniref:DUF1501 domain-containing protein n=1 Tax=Rhodopirellula sp. MGV TaxID=2023130 RepID=UPI000B968CF8|nr:DUF1501 domain-containing protein [Rhodopirellula sp. MGV]OYP38362.1 hypothetical protein CGZ80_02095 [Rhodopirellula sp. MGV]PNY34215.1 DUF1501 domain-containing protein [Rhodopirellula baltica]